MAEVPVPALLDDSFVFQVALLSQPHYYENRDFSVETIRNSIKDGETRTNHLDLTYA